MQLFMTIAAISASLGGVAYTLSVAFSRAIRVHLIELSGWIAFDQIRRGRELLWEDVRAIYRRVSAASGIPTEPHPFAAIAVFERLQALSKASRPIPGWEVRLRGLRRSARGPWLAAVPGLMFYPNFAMIMMVGTAAALFRFRTGAAALTPQQKEAIAGATVFFPIACAVALLCVVVAFIQGQRWLYLRRVRRAVAGARASGCDLLAMIPAERTG